MVLLKHEWKRNVKSLLIWAFCVGACCCGCILLFESVAENMEGMAQMFAEMGSFSAAFGMDKVSIGTIEGYYASEISIIFSVGGAMFAAMTGAVLLAKEEEGHTVEFLHTLPIGRGYIYGWKYAALVVLILVFQGIGIGFDMVGLMCIGKQIPMKEYVWYHVMCLLMQVEIGSICFGISALCKRKQLGLTLGLAVLLYMMEVMIHIVPDLEILKYVTPYFYANAAEIFSGGEVTWRLAALGMLWSVLAVGIGGVIYGKRDLQA